MSASTETSPLEWPRFCYSGAPKMEVTKINKPSAPSGVRKRRAPQQPSSAKLRRQLAAAASAAATSQKMAEPPKIPEFAFSDLMRKMASKYNNTTEDSANKENQTGFPFQHPFLPFPALRGMTSVASLLPLGLSPNTSFVNPFALSALSNAAAASMKPKDPETALDLSPSSEDGEDEVDVLSVDAPPSPPLSNIEDWSVAEVAEFVNSVDTCQEYSEVFRDHCIDGSGLAVLSEAHMTRILGMKLGPVIRLKAAIAQLMRRNSTSSPSSSLGSH